MRYETADPAEYHRIVEEMIQENPVARVAAEAKRANSAEGRTRHAEEQLREIMAVIEQELAAGRPAHG